jgi:hypothetical protein
VELDQAVVGSPRVIGPTGPACAFGWALAAVSVAAAAPTFLVDGILTGPPAMNGSARGTALVVLLLAVPVLLAAMPRARRGSARASVVWLAAVAYLLYNAVLFVFATPFNELFLLYVAMLSLSLWSAVALVRSIDVGGLGARVSPRMPVRTLAVYTWLVVGLNTLGWLRDAVPAVLDERPTAFLADTGLTTNPLYVQDLAFWLPLAAAGAWWLWQRRPWGSLVTGTVLTFWVLEAVGVAVDQAFGHAADPSSSVASAATVWGFAALAVIGLVPAYLFHTHLDRS